MLFVPSYNISTVTEATFKLRWKRFSYDQMGNPNMKVNILVILV